jgi:peroxiredoxin
MKTAIQQVRAILFFAICACVFSCDPSPAGDTSGGKQAAYEAYDFPQGAEWFNTTEKHNIHDFRERWLMLVFFTTSCNQSLRFLSELQAQQSKYPELVLIGVHSARFEGERKSINIKNTLERNGISVPVVNDSKYILWKKYRLHAWPSCVCIDPSGKVVHVFSAKDVLKQAKRVLFQYMQNYKHPVIRKKYEFIRAGKTRDHRVLSYPSGIEADTVNNRLFVSIPEEQVILVLDAEGMILDIIGSGFSGNCDSVFEKSSFHCPRGMVYDSKADQLYIADSENHLIRVADMSNRMVRTVLGKGPCSPEHTDGKCNGRNNCIPMPGDLALRDKSLYISMPESHQLWLMHITTRKAGIIAGNFCRDLKDGPALEACLADPSGIALHKDQVFFIDAGSSSLRLLQNREITTLTGQGLFFYGDYDASGSSARMQYPRGICFHNDCLYIADTYNNTIKVYDIHSREMKSLFHVQMQRRKNPNKLNRPEDMVFLREKLYITDTDHGMIRVFDPISGVLSTLEIRNPDFLNKRLRMKYPLQQLVSDTLILHSGKNIFQIHWKTRENIHFNKFSLNTIKLFHPKERADLFVLQKESGNDTCLMELYPLEMTGVLSLDAELYYTCKNREALCYFKNIRFTFPFQVNDSLQAHSLVTFDVLKSEFRE